MMKIIFIIFVCFLGFGQAIIAQTQKQIQLAQKETLDKSQRVLEELARYHKSKEDYSREQVKVLADSLQDLSYWIYQLIAAEKSPDWANPTSERLIKIKKWGEIIKPYNEVLVKESFSENTDAVYQKLSYESRSLLDFTLPDEVLENETRRFLTASKNLKQMSAAADLLFEHRKLNDADKRPLLKVRSKIADDDEKSLSMWARVIGQYGLQEGLPYLKKQISKPIPIGTTEEELVDIIYSYKEALVLAPKLGPAMKDWLIEIENRKREIKKIRPDYDFYIFDEITTYIRGEKPLERRYANNGSGYLNDLFLSEQESALTDKSPNRLPWIIAAICLIGILALLLNMFKSRKGSEVGRNAGKL